MSAGVKVEYVASGLNMFAAGMAMAIEAGVSGIFPIRSSLFLQCLFCVLFELGRITRYYWKTFLPSRLTNSWVQVVNSCGRNNLCNELMCLDAGVAVSRSHKNCSWSRKLDLKRSTEIVLNSFR